MSLLLPCLLLAVVDGNSVINLLVQLVVVGLIFYVLWWLVNYIGLPEPFGKVARVIIALVAAIFVINALLSIIGGAFIRFY